MIGARHPALARLRRLSRQRDARTGEGAYAVDGPTLLAEALAAGIAVEVVIAEPDAPVALLEQATRAGATVHQAPAGTLARAVNTVTPQPVAAIARFEDPTIERVVSGVARPELVLVLVAVNDPGNAGTLVRSAEAAGVDAVVFGDDSVDPYNPKCVRATAGSLFRVPVVRSADAVAALTTLRQRGLRAVGTVAHGGTPYDRADLTGPTVIVVGSEAHGLPAAVAAQLDQRVSIPMRPPVESLNVGMAGTLVCFEAARQRRGEHADRADRAGQARNPLDEIASSGAGCSAA